MSRILFTCLLLCLGVAGYSRDLVINELVASSDSVSMQADEFGEFDDWVELYNNSGQAIDLSGYYFSDDIAEPDKWSFPAGIMIEATGYLTIWTDSDDEQGDLHTSFKLSKGGEQLIISDNMLNVIDSLTFGEQETNVAWARIPNGTGDFTFRAPTYGFNNEDGSFINEISARNDFDLFPNPAKDQVQIDFSKTDDLPEFINGEITISDIAGRILLSIPLDQMSRRQAIPVDVSNLANGVHFIKIETENELFVQKLMIEQHD